MTYWINQGWCVPFSKFEFIYVFPFPLARNKKNGNIESKILIHSLWYQFILCRLQGKDCCRRGRIQNFTVGYELTIESRILLSKISTPCLKCPIPFVIIKAEFWQWILRMSKPRLAETFIFQPVRMYIINMNNSWMKKVHHHQSKT